MNMFFRKLSSGFLTPARTIQYSIINASNLKPVPEAVSMEKTINSVTLLGRVGSEPIMRGTDKHPLVVFSLATHTNYRYESGEMNQKTDWHRICIFKPTLRETVFNYLKKGQRVHVTGRISYGSVTEDSNTKPATSIIADDVIFFQSVDS